MKSNINIQYNDLNIGIYEMINNVNGKKYFGQTVKPIEKRFKEHCKSPYLIGKAIRKYGPKNFSVKMIIKNIDSQEAANDIEKHLIKEFDTLACSGHGYNIAEGGYGNPFVGMSEEKKREVRKKQSEASKGKPKTEETKQKMRKPKSEEHKRKIGEVKLGKPKSEEHKQKLSEAKLGKPLSEEHKQNMKKPKSEEHKQKLRKPKSEEAKKNISKAKIGKKRGPYKKKT